MGQIFLVSSGTYSDYGIAAVFSSREKAEAWIAARAAHPEGRAKGDGPIQVVSSDDDYQIEDRYELDPLPSGQPDGARGAWCATCLWSRRFLLLGALHYGIVWTDADPNTPVSARRNRWGGIEVTGYGRTQEHAHRSARELARAVIAGTVTIPDAAPEAP